MEDHANCKANRRSWARGRACLPLFAAAAAAVVRIEALIVSRLTKRCQTCAGCLLLKMHN